MSVFESLPKEKTQLLGTSEISLFRHLIKVSKDAPITQNLVYHDIVPVTFLNPKSLPPDIKPELEFEITLSRPLFSSNDIENANFMYLKLDDMYPCPEEWNLKEGNEKDLNSSTRLLLKRHVAEY